MLPLFSQSLGRDHSRRGALIWNSVAHDNDNKVCIDWIVLAYWLGANLMDCATAVQFISTALCLCDPLDIRTSPLAERLTASNSPCKCVPMPFYHWLQSETTIVKKLMRSRASTARGPKCQQQRRRSQSTPATACCRLAILAASSLRLCRRRPRQLQSMVVAFESSPELEPPLFQFILRRELGTNFLAAKWASERASERASARMVVRTTGYKLANHLR